MTETIRQYFRRFDNSITESVYSTLTMEDYYRNKAANQYLDYDSQSLFRKNKLYSGIRNIDNSCYLSATLQILYNIQWLRERIFRIPDQDASDFLKQIQKLFALMYKGTLIYVDPTDLFAVLKKLHPEVFIVGVQNDFHEVFTIILDQLEKSLVSEDDKRFFKKMFYGRMKVQITDEKGKISNNSYVDIGNSFNLINLTSSNKSFDNAIKSFKSQIIDGYISDSGEKMKASKQINFLETPAILSFFINRVSFKDKKLVKDTSEFDFDQKILFTKSSSAKINKNADAEIQKQILQLTNWITSIKQKKQILSKALTYFKQQQQQFANIHTPNICNPLGLQEKNCTKKYIGLQIQGIDKQMQKAHSEIGQLEKKRAREAEESCAQPYNIWAVMIHCGNTADYGHYKICMKVDQAKNLWIQFNDRRAQEISYQKIMDYKKKGEICCLFYRRSSLMSQPEKSQISSSLKKYVQQNQIKIFRKIDEARILQSLYQEYESVSIIWQHQNLFLRQQQRLSTYFFNPLLHLILTGAPANTCKGFLLYQNIKDEKFLQSVKNKFIDKNFNIVVPNLDFGIPSEYWNIYQALKQFLCLQLNNPLEAYQLISFYMDITINDKITNEYFQMLRQVIVLKGIFYQSMFVQYNMLPTYEQFSKTLDRILGFLPNSSSFFLVTVPIRQHIRQSYLQKIISQKQHQKYDDIGMLKRHTSMSPAMIKDIGPTLFCKRFGAWIEQRKRFASLDEEILIDYKKFYHLYIGYPNGK